MSKKDDETRLAPKKCTAKTKKSTKQKSYDIKAMAPSSMQDMTENQKKYGFPSRKKVHTEAQEAYYTRKSEACKKIMEDSKTIHKPLVGRPTTYTEELSNYIIEKVASSAVGLKQMCLDDDKMPDQSTVNLWRWKHPEFSTRYQLAKQHQTYLMGEDCEELSQDRLYYHDASGAQRVDQGYTASQRLIIDTKRWHASKLHPTIFGDRKVVDALQGENEQIKAELMALKEQLAKVNKKEY